MIFSGNRFLAGCVVLACMTAPASAAEPYADDPDGVPGKALYQKFCAPCHGENGDGTGRAFQALDPPPRNFTDAAAREELSRERMIQSVTHGRPGTAMVGWEKRLTPEQIATIVDYIRGSFMKTAAAQAEVPAVTPGPSHQHRGEDVPALEGHEAGRRIYVKNCAVCHGDNGNSAMWTKTTLNPAPRDFTSPRARTELTRERMIRSVTEGRPGTAMMSFTSRLSAEEIEAVVDFIRAAFLNTGAAPAAASSADAAEPHAGLADHPAITEESLEEAMNVDMAAPFPDDLVGDPVKGGEFYHDNCYVCHGKNGDGAGPRAESLRPPPRDFTHPDTRATLNRPALFRAVYFGKPGTVMPAWSKVLDEQQIANVAEYVFQEFIQPAADADKKKLTD